MISAVCPEYTDTDANGLKGFFLILRGALAAGNDGAGMAHLLAFRRGESAM